MKRIVLLLALLLPAAAFGQTYFSGRASVGADYKIAKGLHLTAEEELRMDDGFSSLGSLRTTLGLSYKLNRYVKLGTGYTLISPYKASWNAFNYPRHRFYADVTGYLESGDFQFSLKERLQLTHRTGEFNEFQTAPNALALKSRVGVKYKGWQHFIPGVSAELRVALNDPALGTLGNAGVTKAGKTYHAYTPGGYSAVRANRLRFNLNGEIKFNKHHSLTPYLLMDLCRDFELDTNSEGTRLFSAGFNKYVRITPGLSYVFSF